MERNSRKEGWGAGMLGRGCWGGGERGQTDMCETVYVRESDRQKREMDKRRKYNRWKREERNR